MILRQGNVNKHVAEICTTEVRITFRQSPLWREFDTDTNTMIESEYPDNILYGHGSDAEILVPFLHSHNLIPIWIEVVISADNLVSRISF